MKTNGQPTEGWMVMIPLSVFVFFVMVLVGGPQALVNLVSIWAVDVATYIGYWIKHL
jgi:hypothetical protein